MPEKHNPLTVRDKERVCELLQEMFRRDPDLWIRVQRASGVRLGDLVYIALDAAVIAQHNDDMRRAC